MPLMNRLVTSSLTQTRFQTTRLLSGVRPPTPLAERAKSQSTRVRWYWIQSEEPSACSSSISAQREKLRQPRRATCLPAVSAKINTDQLRLTEFLLWNVNIISSQKIFVNVKVKSNQLEEQKMNNLFYTFEPNHNGNYLVILCQCSCFNENCSHSFQ